jgi:hypothetical protein
MRESESGSGNLRKAWCREQSAERLEFGIGKVELFEVGEKELKAIFYGCLKSLNSISIKPA